MPHPVMARPNDCPTQPGSMQTGEVRGSSLIYWSHLLLGTLHPSSLHSSHFAFTDGFYLCKNIFSLGSMTDSTHASMSKCISLANYLQAKILCGV